MAASATHEIVVFGGNFGGVNLIHHLQRQVFPLLEKLNSSTSYHITLVTPNTHFYFKIAAPRALINPTLIPEEKIFKSIPEAFKQYGESRFSFLRGRAVGLNAASRKVMVQVVNGETRELKYDSLFIATGTTSSSPLWTLHDDHKQSVEALKKTHEMLPEAKTVLIAGGGPVGVETAGEIAHHYPKIKITLISAGEILPKLKPGTIAKAKKSLGDAKVEVMTNVRVQRAASAGSGTKVDLSDGSSKTVDLYIDATGPNQVNNGFLPKTWLDQTGRVNSDKYFRVRGDGQSDVFGIYALGDIVSGSENTAMFVDAMVPVVGASFAVDVAAGFPQDTNNGYGGLLSWLGFGTKKPMQKEFKPMKETIVVPIGPKGGVGQVMGWPMPLFMVKSSKSEKFLMELVEPAMTGEKYSKA